MHQARKIPVFKINHDSRCFSSPENVASKLDMIDALLGEVLKIKDYRSRVPSALEEIIGYFLERG